VNSRAIALSYVPKTLNVILSQKLLKYTTSAYVLHCVNATINRKFAGILVGNG
jgi:hypothetical protein